ncbi:MAG: hypothetical protein JMN26_17185 [gamma proteobacterium endosymbiont of Lamellibrachia anaximandri]|nr:hypothetical protein [gamma proteobacterium endosymbiont of Lamellibrachia anaximandri]
MRPRGYRGLPAFASLSMAGSVRGAVRALNPASDYVRQRLLRSYPRPYIEFDA